VSTGHRLEYVIKVVGNEINKRLAIGLEKYDARMENLGNLFYANHLRIPFYMYTDMPDYAIFLLQKCLLQ
jgi:hypothetical protein